MAKPDQKGITLLGAVLLLVFASLVIFSTTVFIVERARQEQAYQLRTKDIYLAQAGIHNAIYLYRLNDQTGYGYFSKGQTNIDANNFFVLGSTAADSLMVDTSAASLGGTGSQDLLGLYMQNVTNSNTIILDRMVVTWDNSRHLNKIRINGSDVYSGDLSSPADANISDFTVDTVPTNYSINYLRFDGTMTGASISIQFVMTDGSTKSLAVYPASNNDSFIVKATGKTTGSNIYRTIQANYNARTAKITSYNEINTQITP
jgi:hypothetical protein